MVPNIDGIMGHKIKTRKHPRNGTQPKMPNYVTAAVSKSILVQLTHFRAQGIYKGVGVPNSASEQF